jgi:hypothetical protein
MNIDHIFVSHLDSLNDILKLQILCIIKYYEWYCYNFLDLRIKSKLPAFVFHIPVRGGCAGVLPRRVGPALCHGALTIQVRQREAQAHNALLLVQLVHMGGRQHPADMAPVQG